MSVEVVMDGRAHTIVPAEGGELWVERCTADLFQIGTEDSDRYAKRRWASVNLTRAELIEFRDRIDLALQEGR